MYDFHYILHSFSKQLTGCAGDVTGIGIALASTTLLTNLFTNRESIRYFFCGIPRTNVLFEGTTTKLKHRNTAAMNHSTIDTLARAVVYLFHKKVALLYGTLTVRNNISSISIYNCI